MNEKLVLKNISYSVVSNGLAFVISAAMVFLLPKFISPLEYGKWQLFLFYSTFLGFFHFGWEDGMYLRYAGQKYQELDTRKVAGQYWAVMVLQFFLLIIAWIVLNIVDVSAYFYQDLLLLAIFTLPLVNLNNMNGLILQATNRIKEYASLSFINRIIFLIFVLSIIILGIQSYSTLYFSQVMSLVGPCILGSIYCSRLWTKNVDSIRNIGIEARANIYTGIQLMFANIASMLLIGVVRYGISNQWDVQTFGKVSLTLAVSNFILVFISSVSVVFFGILKRIKKDKMGEMYISSRWLLLIFSLFFLCIPIPLKLILSWWLPKYTEALNYLIWIFPMCLFESKAQLLGYTYFNSLRKETMLFKVNNISVAVSFLVTFVVVYLWHNLTLAIFSIVFLYAFRSYLMEYNLFKILDINCRNIILLELLVVAIYYSLNLVFSEHYVYIIVGFLVIYVGLIVFCKSRLMASLKYIRSSINEID